MTTQELISNGDLMSIKDRAFILSGTHLTFACEVGKLNIVKYLIEERNINPTYAQNSPIINAVRGGNLGVVKYLLNIEEVDPTDKIGSTITTAAYDGRLDIIKLLLEHSNFDNHMLIRSVLSSLLNDHRKCTIFILDNNIGLYEETIKALNDEEYIRERLFSYIGRVYTFKTQIDDFLKEYKIKSRENMINTILDERSQ